MIACCHRWIIGIGFFLIVGSPLYGQVAPPTRVLDALRQADRLEKEGTFAAAATALRGRQKELGNRLTSQEKRALEVRLADLYLVWANDAEKRAAWGEAIQHYRDALTIDRSYRKKNAGNELHRIGTVYLRTGQPLKGIEYLRQALPIAHALGDKQGEAVALFNIGVAYYFMSQTQKAMEYYQRAQPLYRAVHNQLGEAQALSNIGILYRDTGKPAQALALYSQALPLYRAIHNTNGEAQTLTNMGIVYADLGELAKALTLYNKALALHRLNKNREFEANTLTNIGIIYIKLNQLSKALEYQLQALPLRRQLGDSLGEANALTNIGEVYAILEQPTKALDYLQQALTRYRAIPDERGEAVILNNLADLYRRSGAVAKALEFYEQALTLAHKTGNRSGEANTLTNLGDISRNQGQHQKALGYFNQALQLSHTIQDKAGEADTLTNLMDLWQDPTFPRRQPSLAIFYGKQCINLYQSMRQSASEIGENELASFTGTVEKAYRQLANLLIERGRILEAQQVLDLLKQQELFLLLRQDTQEHSAARRADLNALEAQADRRIQEQSRTLFALAREEEALLGKPETALTPAEKQRLIQLGELLQQEQVKFQAVLDSLVALFERDSSRIASAANFHLRDSEALTNTLQYLRKKSHRQPVAVYTLVGENRLRFLVFNAASTPLAREYPITAAALHQKLAAFRAALQNPRIDPRPLGKELYDILVQPIAADLAGAQADTVMWSLDSTLRYIPLAALSPDGKSYLVEQGRTHSLFTPAALDSGAFQRDETPRWNALVLAMSRPITVENQGQSLHFDSLDGARDETRVVKKLLPDSVVLLDQSFTRTALEATLRKTPRAFSVVHIASHFHFQPTGDETKSFLLTGDGQVLTLAYLKALRSSIFSGVDLLTLSACATGLGVERQAGTGAEVEGLGVLAQRKGAGAVLASLWAVSDTSTNALMQAFYRLHQSNPRLGKAECLRRAQLALLHGELTLTPSQLGRGIGVTEQPIAGKGLPAFSPAKGAPASHPFYWAPFFLMGNWR